MLRAQPGPPVCHWLTGSQLHNFTTFTTSSLKFPAQAHADAFSLLHHGIPHLHHNTMKKKTTPESSVKFLTAPSINREPPPPILQPSTMRLNVTILRHCLPPTQVLWPISPDQCTGAAVTISKLLASVDEIFPLESDDWGFDDYAVEVNGFECLHFSIISQILRDGDHVT